jgi:hypothetical protein
MDVQIKLRREECAGGMGHRSNYATLRDVLILHKEKEFA